MVARTRRAGAGQPPPPNQATSESNPEGNGTPDQDTAGTPDQDAAGIQQQAAWATATRRPTLQLELRDTWMRTSSRRAA